jgi:peroxiredoxin Q/BCP
LVLFFYPKDSSPGCTQQACSFRDSYASLLKFGVSIAGISKDSAESHQTFAENNDLPYPLLLDSKGKIHDQYGCTTLLGLVTKRVTFVIGQDKRILLRYEDNFRMKSHVKAVTELLEKK